MIPLALVMAVTLVATAACTPAEIEQLRGVLQNVDSANGKITIVTEDGKTITLKIDTETETTAEGDNVTIRSLKPGSSVEVEVKEKDKDKEQTAKRIKVRRSETGEKETEGSERVGWGIVEIRVTDPPPANVKSALVHLSSIEVHMAGNDVSDNSSDNTSGWITVIGAPASFDLMSVIGIDQILGSANLTAGKYTQIRMSVANVTGVTTDNVSYTAEVPGDKVKIVGSFNVGDGKKTVLTLDFDGEKSLVRTGEGKFLFKPVVKLLVNNGGKGSEDNRGESIKGKSGENEGKGNSDNNSGKRD